MSSFTPGSDRPDDGAACEHDWRLNRSWKETHYESAPDPALTTAVIKSEPMVSRFDEWYCTKCRLIEELPRV